jgi:geranylgeranyl diphosphate synthase type II
MAVASTSGLTQYLSEVAALVEAALDRLLPAESVEPRELHRAMRYSALGGGKRVRPALVCLGAELFGGHREAALPLACAFECVHVYSLIHDDLPAMDDDDFRRGRPSNHKVFGEALAILAGDGLLTFAFELAAGSTEDPARARAAVLELARAAGPQAGMVGGQTLDLRGEGRTTEPVLATIAALEAVHLAKTAALITGAVRAGAIHGGAEPEGAEAVGRYGRALGLAFQVVDDILDVEGTTQDLGKTAGKDAAAGKLTYPGLLGLDAARAHARRLVDDAKAALAPYSGQPAAALLADLADLVRDRRS